MIIKHRTLCLSAAWISGVAWILLLAGIGATSFEKDFTRNVIVMVSPLVLLMTCGFAWDWVEGRLNVYCDWPPPKDRKELIAPIVFGTRDEFQFTISRQRMTTFVAVVAGAILLSVLLFVFSDNTLSTVIYFSAFQVYVILFMYFSMIRKSVDEAEHNPRVTKNER